MTKFCGIHGTYEEGNWSDVCPKCREAEERAEERIRKAEALAQEARERDEERAQEARALAIESRGRAEDREREDRELAKELARAAQQRSIEAQERDEERTRDDREWAEERAREAEERREELEDERAEEAIYRHANPGDYICNSCKYITLLKGASRCPSCHGDVPHSYWRDVDIKEEAERRAAQLRKELAAREAELRRVQEAEEWERTKPEREAAAAAALAAEEAKERERIAAETTARMERRGQGHFSYLRLLWSIPLWGVGGAIIGGIPGGIYGAFSPTLTADMGVEIWGIIGATIGIFITLVHTINIARGFLSETGNLIWADGLAITVAAITSIICIGSVPKFVRRIEAEDQRQRKVTPIPKAPPQDKTKFRHNKKSVPPENNPQVAPASTKSIETTLKEQDISTSKSITYKIRRQMLYDKKYQEILGGINDSFTVSGSCDTTLAPSEVLQFSVQRAGFASPIRFHSESLVPPQKWMQSGSLKYAGSCECDAYSGPCDIDVRNNGGFILLVMRNPESTGNNSITTFAINKI
ncbi:MAG: hypothetical protein IPP78_15700 [Holophagaceae bacterium]|nr:hypothetical protein [Holophagaceae bacterium]